MVVIIGGQPYLIQTYGSYWGYAYAYAYAYAFSLTAVMYSLISVLFYILFGRETAHGKKITRQLSR